MAELFAGQEDQPGPQSIADALGPDHPALARKALVGEPRCANTTTTTLRQGYVQCEQPHGHPGRHMAVVQTIWE